jgi:hypothetical protein
MKDCAITHLAEFWRADGIEVEFLAGVDRFVPADLAIVHVNLSVVPKKYLAFAHRYPRVINGTVADIRKSVTSRMLVSRRTAYRGPVIVKSDLNFGGVPERTLAPPSGRRVRHPFVSSLDYVVYDDVSQVPSRYFRSRQAVVEKFVPEREDGMYHVRTLEYLGDRYTSLRLASHEPVVKEGSAIEEVVVTPHPDALAATRELGMDYGKIDYVLHGGTFHLLDVNKTPGASAPGETVNERRRHRAEGIEDYLS